jgi:hypothetical protein
MIATYLAGENPTKLQPTGVAIAKKVMTIVFRVILLFLMHFMLSPTKKPTMRPPKV